jgi:hypothetical protein
MVNRIVKSRLRRMNTMINKHPSKGFWVGLVTVLASLACSLVLGRTETRAQSTSQSAIAGKWVGKYQEAAACMECHTKPTAANRENKSLDFVLMTEYAIWKTFDKHAQAYVVLEGPRGKAMAEILQRDVRDAKTGCMNCHAMSSLFGERSVAELEKKPPDGVSCGGCHGPSRDWIALHNNPQNPELWRNLTPAQKEEDAGPCVPFRLVRSAPLAPPRPVVTGLSKTSGSTVGGSTGNHYVTVIGSGFTGATGVKFGTTAASSYTIQILSDNALQVQVPSASSTVTAPGGTSATSSADHLRGASAAGRHRPQSSGFAALTPPPERFDTL